MRRLAAGFVLLVLATTIRAQNNEFPLTANVVSSGEETVPGTGGVTTQATSPEVRAQFPDTPATHTVRVRPETQIITRVEIDERAYVVRGTKLIDPGTYPASVDGRWLRLLTKDKHGNAKTLKLYILSVEAKH